jgi:hypothetical protein
MPIKNIKNVTNYKKNLSDLKYRHNNQTKKFTSDVTINKIKN